MAATRTCATSISALALTYVAGILPNTTVWASGTAPLPPKKWSGRGRPPKLLRRDAKHQPISVKELALGLPKRAWRTIKWREGAAERLSSRFARVRVRVAHRDYKLTEQPAGRMAVDRVAKGRGRADQILALNACPKTSPSAGWSTSPSCAGASSATIRNSSRRSGSGISKGEDGVASTTTPRCSRNLPVLNQHLDDADWKNAAVLIAALHCPVGSIQQVAEGSLPLFFEQTLGQFAPSFIGCHAGSSFWSVTLV